MKAVVYARVSTEIQDEERQLFEIRNYCNKNNFEIINEFNERQSGFKKAKDREALNEMLKFVYENEVDYIIVWELSRLGRTHEVLNIIEDLNKKKICLISIKDNLETLRHDKSINPSSNLLISILSGINTFEVDTLKARIKSGIKYSRSEGNAPGSNNLPYGYRKDTESKKLKIDDKESEIIIQIFNLYLEGNGTKKIANWLNENDVETRNKKLINTGNVSQNYKYKFKTKWVDGTIYSILRNRIYIGKRKHTIGKEVAKDKKTNEVLRTKKGKEVIRDVYEEFEQQDLRIIDDDTFFKVQNRLSNNDSKSGNYKYFDYLIDNKKITCGCCGKNYFPHKRRKFKKDADGNKVFLHGVGKDNRYVCLSKRYNDKCDNVGISIDKIERLVQIAILDHHTELLQENLENKSLLAEIKEQEDKLADLYKKLRIENKKEGDYAEMRVEGEITKEVYLQKVKDIHANQDNIKNKIRLIEEIISSSKKTYENIIDISSIKHVFNWGDTRIARIPKNVVNAIITNIIVLPFEKAPEEIKEKFVNNEAYKRHFRFKNDILILITLFSNLNRLHYIISQRADRLYDYQKDEIWPYQTLDLFEDLPDLPF